MPKGVTAQLEVKKYLGAREHDYITSIVYHDKKFQPTISTPLKHQWHQWHQPESCHELNHLREGAEIE